MTIRRAVLTVGLALATTVVTAIAPTPAFADTAIQVVQIPCPSWVPGAVGVYGQPEYVISASENFEVTESRLVRNDTDFEVTASFSSEQSHTFSIAVTSGVTFNNLFGFLNANVSNTITSSTTTTIGVTAETTVPAHTTVIGDYGVDVFSVTFMGYVVIRRSIGGCWVRQSTMGHDQQFTPAPTYIQGWRIRQA